MAVIKWNPTCKMVLKVANGTSASGGTKYANRTISNMNPGLNDAVMYNLGNGIAALQTHALGGIQRYDIAELTEE